MVEYIPPPYFEHHGADVRPFDVPKEYAGTTLHAPTPLDPYRVRSSDGDGYIKVSADTIYARTVKAAEAVGLPGAITDSALQEQYNALDVRVTRNEESYVRLMSAVDRGDEHDEGLLGIIDKARASGASHEELLRLIKRHPEMISVEFYKRHSLFDGKQHDAYLREIMSLVWQLHHEFHDAEIAVMPGGGIVTTKPFTTEAGAVVWKEKVADCRTVDSHTEIIVKQSAMIIPATVQLRGVRLNHKTINGTTLNLLPLSISAYYRSADYRSREGYYSPEETEVRHELTPEVVAALGDRAQILGQIPEGMHGEYLRGFLRET